MGRVDIYLNLHVLQVVICVSGSESALLNGLRLLEAPSSRPPFSHWFS